jgi:hypothetical protein
LVEQRLALRHDQEICFGSKLDSEKEYGFLLPRTTQTQRSISLVTITERIQLLHRVSVGFRRYRDIENHCSIQYTLYCQAFSECVTVNSRFALNLGGHGLVSV